MWKHKVRRHYRPATTTYDNERDVATPLLSFVFDGIGGGGATVTTPMEQSPTSLFLFRPNSIWDVPRILSSFFRHLYLADTNIVVVVAVAIELIIVTGSRDDSGGIAEICMHDDRRCTFLPCLGTMPP